MAQRTRSNWTYLLWALFAVFAIVLIWQIVSGTGLLPGDTGRDVAAGTNETSGSGQMNLGAWPWTLTVLGGTIILGVAIAWAEFRNRRLTQAEWDAGEAKTREIYKSDT